MWSPSQAAARREIKRSPLFYSYINLWPFVAVLLALLIVFMVGGPPIHGDVAVDLPSAFQAKAQPKARAEDAFRNHMAQPESLPFFIRNAVQEGAERKIYLAVDLRARYSDAAAVVEQIRNAGIEEICILAYKREKQIHPRISVPLSRPYTYSRSPQSAVKWRKPQSECAPSIWI